MQNADGGQEAFFLLKNSHCADVLCCLWLLQLIQPKTKTRAFHCIPDIAVYKEKKCKKLSEKCWEKEKFFKFSSRAVKDVALVDWGPKTNVQHTCNHMTADKLFHEPVLSEKTFTNKMSCRTHC